MARYEKFRNVKVVKYGNYGDNLETTYAEVDRITRPFPWTEEKRETITVFKENMNWRFLDSGEFTPADVIENLHAAYRAKELLEDE